MKVQLFIVILFSFFTQVSFAQYYNPTLKEFKKMEEEFKKGKSKTFDKLLDKGLHPYSINPYFTNNIELIRTAIYWETYFKQNNVGFNSFVKLADKGFDPNLESPDDAAAPGLDRSTLIRPVIAGCSIKTFKYLVSKGANYKRVWKVSERETFSILTPVFASYPDKSCNNEDLKEAIQTAIDYGVDICADNGRWIKRPSDDARVEVVNYYYHKYKDEASCF
jgi:hypothetical protein